MKLRFFDPTWVSAAGALLWTLSMCHVAWADIQHEKPRFTESDSLPQLVKLAEDSQNCLKAIQSSVDLLEPALGSDLSSPVKAAIKDLKKYVADATLSAAEATTLNHDEEKLKYRLAVMKGQVEMARSALTRLKLGLSIPDISEESRRNLISLEEKIDALRGRL
jgi:hypothetical protein